MSKKKGSSANISPAVRVRLAYAFNIYDHRKSGYINLDELKSVMGALNVSNDDSQVKDVLRLAGAEGDKISKEGFIVALADKILEPGSPEELKYIFGKFSNRSGKMEDAELGDLAEKAGYPLTKPELANIITRGDRDKDGGWKLDQFIGIVNQKS